MEEAVNYIFTSGTIDESARRVAAGVRNIALGLLPLFFVLTQAWNFASTTVKNMGGGGRPGIFKMEEIIRAGVLWLLVLCYIPVFSWMGNLAGAINSLTIPTEVTKGQSIYNEYISDYLKPPSETESETDFWTLTWDFLSAAQQTLTNISSAIINGLVLVILSVIRLIIEGIAIYMAKVFYAIGPVVIAFAVLPPFKDKLDRWFGIYLTVLLLPTTLNILDYLIYASFQSAVNMEYAANPVADLVYGITIIVMYLLSFWITSFFVGGSEAGKVLSTAASLATLAAGAGMSTKLGTAAGGSGAADAVGTAKDVIEG